MDAIDPMLAAVAALFVALAALFARERGQLYLTFFQQEEYDAPRFLRWLREQRAYDRVLTWALVAVALVWALGWRVGAETPFVLMAVALPLGFWRNRAVRRGTRKKPLVKTQRARRILAVYQTLAVLALIAAVLTTTGLVAVLAVIAIVQLLPFGLLAADGLLKPFERRVKARYRAEAVDKLARLDPHVIAITGSYGKTSTKHILAHILSSVHPTLATPGSVNTEMGITRVIREGLEDRHRYFIAEMGAYGPGSIARLCRLAPPKLAAITAVGWAHYERFRTVEAVFHAKFEMADAAIAAGGPVVVNADGVPADMLRARLADRPGDYVLVGGPDSPFDPAIRMTDVAQTADGLTLTIAERTADGGRATTTLTAPLYGLHQAGNIAVAVAIARRLDLPMETIKAALATAPQTRHRLEVTRGPNQPAIIDDAYNSNPVGFASALDLMDVLKGDGADGHKGRRILLTPGMVELGAKHDEQHLALGRRAGETVDVALVVTPDRIPTFLDGFNETRADGAELKTFAAQAEAEAWVKANARAGDVVLFENNLPDLYEARVRF